MIIAYFKGVIAINQMNYKANRLFLFFLMTIIIFHIIFCIITPNRSNRLVSLIILVINGYLILKCEELGKLLKGIIYINKLVY